MIERHDILSLDLPALAPYRTLKRQAEHERAGLFVAEGDKVVARLLQQPHCTIISAVLPREWFERLGPQFEQRPELIDVYVAPKAVLEQLVGYPLYQGVLALARHPAVRSLADACAITATPRLFVALDGITNAENIGAIVRNAAALGTQVLLVGDTSASPYLRRAVRSSMGAIFKVETVTTANLEESLIWLEGQGVKCVAACPQASGSLSRAHLRGDICLVVGHEGLGISARVLSACSERLAIPMHAGIDSLNVASAVAVFLYEIQRQRELAGPATQQSIL